MPKLKGSEKMKILFVSSEAEPFAHAGGLGSVMYSLPLALQKIGHDARVMVPRYLDIDDAANSLEMEHENLSVPTGNSSGEPFLTCNVKKYTGGTQPGKEVTTYFLENQEYYETRANIYGYADDPVRWALLSRGALEFLRVSEWVPDIVVTADWMTGYLANYLKTVYQNDPPLSKIAAVHSIHNLYYQGPFKHLFMQPTDFDDGHSPIPAFEDPRLCKINGMKRGIMYADVINTVSPTYAKEILTPEFGEGLDGLLNERRHSLYGIINGLNYELWNPATDPNVTNNFTAKKLDQRTANKEELQQYFGLPVKPESFLIGMVSRMRAQKGFDLLEPVLEPLLKELDIQLVIMGDGDTKYMQLFQDLQEKFPDQVATYFKFDSVLPHKIFSGVDATIIPSRYEPCGLTQMEAMRYGAIPIVRKTGGLADTVEDFSVKKDTGTGFVFDKSDFFAMTIAIVRAYETFSHQKVWRKLQQRAMEQDFSWENSAKQYEDLFKKAISVKLEREQ